MFEIYFIEQMQGSSGDWWGAFVGAFISGIVAIGIFWRGNIVTRNNAEKNRIEEARTRQQEREVLNSQNLDHFIQLLKGIVKDKHDTFEFNQDFAVKYRDDPYGYHKHKIEIPEQLFRIHKLDSFQIRQGLHLKFPDKKKAEKHFQNLYGAIDFYKVHGEISKQNIYDLKDDWTIISKQIKNYVEDLRSEIAEYLEVEFFELIGDDYRDHQLYKTLGRIQNDYITNLKEGLPLGYHLNEYAQKICEITNAEFSRIKGASILFNKAKKIQNYYYDLSVKGHEIYNTIEMMDRELPKVNQKMEKFIQTHFDPDFTKEKLEVTEETN